jgi:hypothetical protein
MALVACREKAEARRRERERLKLQMARLFAPDAPEAFAVALLPSNDRPIGNLPEERRRVARDHLTRLISQAAAQRSAAAGSPGTTSGPSDASAQKRTGDEAAVARRACATCGGRCCQPGGEHGYQTADDLRRYMAAHPEERPRHLVMSYLSRLPARSYRDSCVYHAEVGCVLPREMRSATCNAFHCEDIEDFHEELREASFRRGIAVATCDDEIVRTAFIGEAELACAPRASGAGGTSGAPAAEPASSPRPTPAESRDRGDGGFRRAARGSASAWDMIRLRRSHGPR